MGQTFDLAKAREAVRRTRRQMAQLQGRPDVNSAPISFAAGKARHDLREAAAAVTQLVELLGASREGRIDFALVRKIRAAERRVSQAREALSRIDPPSAR